MFVMWGKQNKTTLIHVNISFIASENPLNTNENCREISLELSQSAMKFCANLRRLQRNIVVAQTIGLAKYGWKIAPNKISLIIVEYSRISPNYVCITFAQYCIVCTLVHILNEFCHAFVRNWKWIAQKFRSIYFVPWK